MSNITWDDNKSITGATIATSHALSDDEIREYLQDAYGYAYNNDDKYKVNNSSGGSKYHAHVFHTFFVGIIFAGFALSFFNAFNNLVSAQDAENVSKMQQLIQDNNRILYNDARTALINSQSSIDIMKRKEEALNLWDRKSLKEVGLVPVSVGDNALCILYDAKDASITNLRMCRDAEEVCVDQGVYVGCTSRVKADFR